MVRDVCFAASIAALAFACPVFGASRICTSADTLSFGEQFVGTSASARVTVSNCGDAPFSFTDVSPHAATNPGFHVQTSCTTGSTLAPGASCDATIAFAPTTPGQASGALWLHNTTSTPDQLVTFYGRGVDAQAGSATIAFSPAIVDFGSIAVGDESPALTLTLANTGAAALVPSRFGLNGVTPYDFRGALGHGPNDCAIGRAIAAGASCTLSLFFRPQAPGQRQADLVIDAPQLAALAIVTIHGTGANGAPTIDVVEFHNADDGQYFLTADAREMALLDEGAIGAGWSRTGASFKGWPIDASDARALPVCRFFGTPGVGPVSHFYTAYANECDAVRHDMHWIEEGATFRARLPVNGACSDADLTVLRLWKPGDDVTQTRHRYVVDAAITTTMQAQGWVLEGAVFCSPR
jgi:hypothetical protein